MPTYRFKKQILFIQAALTLFCFSTCRKDISVPHTELEKLFGKWEWVESTGGDNGKIINPASEGYTLDVSFERNGISKWYTNSTLKEKLKFTIASETDSTAFGTLYKLDFKPTGLFNKVAVIQLNNKLRFIGMDTLILSCGPSCNDMYDDTYVRK